MYLKKFNYYLIIFLSSSIIGWVGEILYSLIFRDKLVIPGNIPPFCPIYGTGIVTLLIIINNKENRILSFVKMVLAGTIVEYISAYISEEFFNHIIWDYSNHFLNIDGRVCLLYSLMWGVLGYIFIYFIEPKIKRIYKKFHSSKLDLFFYIIFILFIMSIVLKVIISL